MSKMTLFEIHPRGVHAKGVHKKVQRCRNFGQASQGQKLWCFRRMQYSRLEEKLETKTSLGNEFHSEQHNNLTVSTNLETEARSALP